MLVLSTVVLFLLSFGLASSMVELGLVAYGVWVDDQSFTYEYYCGYDYSSVCTETIKGSVPDFLSLLMFSSIWSTLITVAAIGVPLWFHKRNGHHHNNWLAPTLIVTYFLTWVFWLASFAYFVYLIGSGTGIAAAILAFGVINWYVPTFVMYLFTSMNNTHLFLGRILYMLLFIFSFLAIFEVMQGEWPGYLSMKGQSSTASAPVTSHTTSDPAYTAGPAEPKYEHELSA